MYGKNGLRLQNTKRKVGKIAYSARCFIGLARMATGYLFEAILRGSLANDVRIVLEN